MNKNEIQFSIAAARHYSDGELLKEHKRNDNAMCHYAFSSECGLKAFLEIFLNKDILFWSEYDLNKLGKVFLNKKSSFIKKIKIHDVDELWKYYNWLSLVVPDYALLTELESSPSVLFDNHPDRRYYDNQYYTDDDIESSRQYAKALLERLIACTIDGRIQYPCTKKENKQ